MNVYCDTESTSLHGMPVLIQYAYGDDEPTLFNIWEERVGDTLALIEEMLEHTFIGFNVAHDAFQLCKLYTTFALFGDMDAYPLNHLDELGMLEERARFTNICIKPKGVFDVMLHARKTRFQSLMARDPIKINRVPTALAWQLAKELDSKVHFEDIFFAKSKKKKDRWKVYDILGPDGNVNPNFKTVKLNFNASSALKNLYKHVFKPEEQVFAYSDIEIGNGLYSEEPGYAPFARAIAPNAPKDWGRSWVTLLRTHCSHWYYRKEPRIYAANDVIYTRRLYKEAFGSPPEDVDSILSWMVAAVRWHGYNIDLPGIQRLKRLALEKLGFDPSIAKVYETRKVDKEAISKFSTTPMAPKQVKAFVGESMSPTERLGFQNTKKTTLEAIATDELWQGHPSAARAQLVLNARMSRKEIEVYEKLLLARRFHASFKVGGALSNRMAGDSGLNPQGVKHQTYVRVAFPLADSSPELLAGNMGLSVTEVNGLIAKGEVQLTELSGGDFKSFEVSLAAKEFNDPKLDAALKSGKKIHALFGMELFPGNTYEQICASEGKEPDLYDKGKKGIFAMFYGGEAHTLITRLGVSQEAAEKAFIGIGKRFPGIKTFGDMIRNDFSALAQAGGIGTKVEWNDPKEFVESFLGFKRFFTLENDVMKVLFELAQKVPKEWRNLKIKVMRRDRMQTAAGAVSSSLYGAAFGIQSRNIRAAKNHKIQSPGAEITKATQANIWTLQPVGVHRWIVQPMNIHDEIMTPTAKGYESQVEAKAQETVSYFRKQVPLLAIDWMTGIANWGEKKGKAKVHTESEAEAA